MLGVVGGWSGWAQVVSGLCPWWERGRWLHCWQQSVSAALQLVGQFAEANASVGRAYVFRRSLLSVFSESPCCCQGDCNRHVRLYSGCTIVAMSAHLSRPEWQNTVGEVAHLSRPEWQKRVGEVALQQPPCELFPVSGTNSQPAELTSLTCCVVFAPQLLLSSAWCIRSWARGVCDGACAVCW